MPKKARTRSELSGTKLADILEPHIEDPRCFEKTTTGKQMTAAIQKKTAMWKSLLDGSPKVTFTKKVVTEAFLTIRSRKASGWKMKAEKSEKWAECMGKRFRGQASFLQVATNKQLGWAMAIAARTSSTVTPEVEENSQRPSDVAADDAAADDAADAADDDNFDEDDDDDDDEEEEEEEEEEEDDADDEIEGKAEKRTPGAEAVEEDPEVPRSQKHLLRKSPEKMPALAVEATEAITTWDVELKNAFRYKIVGGEQAEWATRLELPATDEPDAPMVAVFEDGSKSEVHDFTVRDHRAREEAEEVPPKFETFFSKTMGNKEVMVSKRQIKKGEKDIICLHHGGRQITLLTPSDQQSEGECVTMMIKVAEAYIGDKIGVYEARLLKTDLSDTLKKEKADIANALKKQKGEEAKALKKQEAEEEKKKKPASTSGAGSSSKRAGAPLAGQAAPPKKPKSTATDALPATAQTHAAEGDPTEADIKKQMDDLWGW